MMILTVFPPSYIISFQHPPPPHTHTHTHILEVVSRYRDLQQAETCANRDDTFYSQ